MNRLHAFFLFLALAAADTAAAAAASFSASGTGPSVVLSISYMTCTSRYSHVRTSFLSFLRPAFINPSVDQKTSSIKVHRKNSSGSG